LEQGQRPGGEAELEKFTIASKNIQILAWSRRKVVCGRRRDDVTDLRG